jgi:hypothetical protein
MKTIRNYGLSLILISTMTTSCKRFDPMKCPIPKSVGERTHEQEFLARVSCSFQKMCLATINYNTHERTCKEMP